MSSNNEIKVTVRPENSVSVQVRNVGNPVKIRPLINTDVQTVITYENLDGGEF